ncbi:MAG: hypothetical protein ABIR51_05415 [Sphingomicrobium sp.]
MSARGFRSVIMTGAVASAALGCYLISLRVAFERAELEGVETKIVLAQRDIRLLETEIGTRGRLAQLERWNLKAIQLSAPTADQFVDNGFQLATLVKPDAKPAVEVPVVLASLPRETAPARAESIDDSGAPPPASNSAGDLMHVASYRRPASPAPRLAPPTKPNPAVAATIVPAKTLAKPATKPVKTATADPLAALPSGASKAKGSGIATKRSTKEPGSP